MESDIAIIGGGICGLSTAYILIGQGYKVKVFATSFPPETTSNKAAAFWFPYHIKSDERCISWSRTSYEKYLAFMADPTSGVSMHQLLKVTKRENKAAGMIWQNFLPEGSYKPIEKKELKQGFKTGFVVNVPLVETQLFLPWLMDNLKQNGVNFVKREIRDLKELSNQYRWVVNCSGLGSRELCKDETLYPVRGQIATTVPHQGLPIFLYEEQPFYIVPRKDATLIGGTYEEGVWDTTPEAETIAKLYKQAVSLYPELARFPVNDCWAGLRPFRPEIRVEREPGKNIIHNYGHGGSGFTLAWGCAEDVLKMVRANMT